MRIEKKIFVRKTYDGTLYKWSPDTNINKIKIDGGKPVFGIGCNPKDAAAGEDNFVTYTYDLVTSMGIDHKFAYVECGYVE